MDNLYCSGILSADGHQWATTGIATDYMEKSFADFPRSYPDMQEEGDLDAMAYAPTGFIWDDALAHGKTVRDYGECSVAVTWWKDPKNKKPPTFLDYYDDFINHRGLIVYSNYPGVPSLQAHIMTNTVGWLMAVPDVFRAAQFIGELKGFEERGDMPNLCIIDLPNDHTSGTDPGQPIPAAQVADNDLAFGQIVEEISHRPAIRLGPCERLSHHWLRGQCLYETPHRGQRELQPDRHAQDDGVNAGTAPDESNGRVLQANVGMLHRDTRLQAVRLRDE